MAQAVEWDEPGSPFQSWDFMISWAQQLPVKVRVANSSIGYFKCQLQWRGEWNILQYKFCEKAEIEYFFGLVSISGDKKYI